MLLKIISPHYCVGDCCTMDYREKVTNQRLPCFFCDIYVNVLQLRVIENEIKVANLWFVASSALAVYEDFFTNCNKLSQSSNFCRKADYRITLYGPDIRHYWTNYKNVFHSPNFTKLRQQSHFLILMSSISAYFFVDTDSLVSSLFHTNCTFVCACWSFRVTADCRPVCSPLAIAECCLAVCGYYEARGATLPIVRASSHRRQAHKQALGLVQVCTWTLGQ